MRFLQQTYILPGRLTSVTDPLGAMTSYTYDVTGNLVAVTNALDNVTIYEYDLRGNKTYEGGATYPVRYTYDDFNVMTNMINQSKEFWKPEYHAHGVFASGIENEITLVLYIAFDGWFFFIGTDFDHYMRPPNKGRDMRTGLPCPENDGTLAH